jgi:hypothetical protein
MARIEPPEKKRLERRRFTDEFKAGAAVVLWAARRRAEQFHLCARLDPPGATPYGVSRVEFISPARRVLILAVVATLAVGCQGRSRLTLALEPALQQRQPALFLDGTRLAATGGSAPLSVRPGTHFLVAVRDHLVLALERVETRAGEPRAVTLRGDHYPLDVRQRFAQEVLTGAEYGHAAEACLRWPRSPRVSVLAGDATHEAAVRRVVAQLNNVLAHTPIRLELLPARRPEADVEIHFVPLADFGAIARARGFQYPAGNVGFFWLRWSRATREISHAVVLIASDRLWGNMLDHVVLEEVTQSLGPINDTAVIRDSMFFAGNIDAENRVTLAPVDAQLLTLLYNRLEPGSGPAAVRTAVATHWIE